MRRGLLAVLAATLVLPASAGARTVTRGNWDMPAQRTAARAGLLAGGAGARPLSAAALRRALRTLAGRSGTDPVRVTSAPTVASFDRALVLQFGLGDTAQAVQAEARRAGLAPPGRFGTEVVARMLGLRHNFPSSLDRLELFPSDRITRAEAAWSLAQVAHFSDRDTANAAATLAAFQLPAYSAAERQALRIAVSRIGYPYIWGGETDTAGNTYYGPQAHGGYDCSGFVWRVFKLSGLAAGRRIRGRTADQMAKEIPRGSRLPFSRVRAGDILFFGTRAYVSHTGIALSRHFMIHSSDQGVYISSLDDPWRRHEFVWARRVL